MVPIKPPIEEQKPLAELLANVLSLQVWAAKTSLVGSGAPAGALEKTSVKRQLAEQAMELVLMRFEEDSPVRLDLEDVREQCVDLMIKILGDPKFQPQLRFEEAQHMIAPEALRPELKNRRPRSK